MDKYLSDYEKLINEYERIESKLSSLFMDTQLSDSSKKKLELTMKRRLRVLLPEIRKKENEV